MRRSGRKGERNSQTLNQLQQLSHYHSEIYMKQLDSILEEKFGLSPGSFEAQPKDEFGHYTTSAAMKVAKETRKNPRAVAEEMAEVLRTNAPEGLIEKIEIAGPGFINVWLTNDAIQKEFEAVAENGTFGNSTVGKGKKVIIEYSQPNIAKQMHTGHLRNTILGESIARLHEANGYEVIRWNYLGDWGTQFGKLIVAYKMWGGDVDLEERPIEKLEAMYVRFHEAMAADPSLEEKGREEFRKLEEGDGENRKLWELFKEASLKEIGEVYDILNVTFDIYIGEAFFETKMQPLVEELLEKKVAEVSEGAVIIPLEAEGLPPALIRKSDGASLYLTRDIAALEYRAKEYKPQRLLYVVGNEQSLHFQQLMAVAKILGIAEGVDLEHVKYGLLLGAEGKKMSTRKGTAISVRGLIDEAVSRSIKVIEEKNQDISEEDKKNISEVVGVGALKYFMLHESKTSDIIFDWDKMLSFHGDSGPYLQYTYARLKRVSAKAGEGKADLSRLLTEHELRLMRKLLDFPHEVERSAKELITNNLTNYLFELANFANRFYEDQHILTDEDKERLYARVLLATTTADTIGKGLDLLGIKVLDSI
jgi:arginyl-tRNA synthetase